MRESQAMIPWWIINTFDQDLDPEFGSLKFSSLVAHQLERWSRRSQVMRGDSGQWWHIDNLDLQTPKTPAQLHSNLSRFVLDHYPLRRHGGQPPAISGAIDNNELRVALIGDVRDHRTRAYLHCLGKFIRLNVLSLLDPIDVKLLAFVSIPHNSHLAPDREAIALFLAELHTMMLQPPAHRPFDWVVFSQDKNFSPPHRRTGYDHLAPGELLELMAQSLFHTMIGEGQVLRDIAENYSPAYLSVGSVSFYYDWSQHKQRLAAHASRTLVNIFTTSKEPPFVDLIEAETAIATISDRFRTPRLLNDLVRVSSRLAKESMPERKAEETKTTPPQTGEPQLPAEAVDPLQAYRYAVHRSEQLLEKGSKILWNGGFFEFRSTERTIIESVQGIFIGEYGAGSARALEQALLVLGKLGALLEDEHKLRAVNDLAFADILKALDLTIEPSAPPDKPGSSGGQQFSSLALLQVLEWLATIPLWAKLVSGLLFGGSGYALYRKLRAKRAANDQPPKELTRPDPKEIEEKRRLQEELRGKVQNSLGDIYIQAITLIKKLETFIGEVQDKTQKEFPTFLPLYAYKTTAFCRSVFDELAVPGRLPLKALITNGSFAPTLPVNDQQIKFKDFENQELHLLINEFLDERPKKALPCLAPEEIGYADPKELSEKSAHDLPVIFYDFASDLYERSAPLSMDEALRYIKATGGQERLLSFVAEVASPPVIFSPGNINRPTPYVEFKYHDLDLLNAVFDGQLDVQKRGSHAQIASVNDGDLLSVGIYQPILTSRQGEFPSLDSVHTIGVMKGPMSVPATPSLVFTLATMAEDSMFVSNPMLISPTNGVPLLTPDPVARDISLLRRELIGPLYDLKERPALRLLPEHYVDDNVFEELAEDTTESGATKTYDVMAVAGVKNHPADLPFHLGAEYLLQAGLRSSVPEGFSGTAVSLSSDEESFEFHILVHADDMEVLSEQVQTFTFKSNVESPFVEFRLRPIGMGHKLIRVEFLYQRHWIAHIRLEVDVINAYEPALTA